MIVRELDARLRELRLQQLVPEQEDALSGEVVLQVADRRLPRGDDPVARDGQPHPGELVHVDVRVL